MKNIFLILVLLCSGSLFASSSSESDRENLCRQNYSRLFGGEALSPDCADPEMMEILQKFIFADVFSTPGLTIKQREMITCVVLSCIQTLPQLKAHAKAALNVGVSPIELRECVYLTAPYIGFPRTLNALGALNEVFAEAGIKLPLERQASSDDSTRGKMGLEIQQKLYGSGIAGAMEGVPGGMGKRVSDFLTEYCFGDIYTRKGLDLATRELLGYCALTAIEAESQLKSHYHGALKAGNSPEILAAAVIQTLPYIGFPPAIRALKIIKNESSKAEGSNFVRLSKIRVKADMLGEYNSMLKEEIEASMALENGVLVLYAVSSNDDPSEVYILEIYADKIAYESHLNTPHFKKYKQGTLNMVEHLELLDVNPLIPGLKIK